MYRMRVWELLCKNIHVQEEDGEKCTVTPRGYFWVLGSSLCVCVCTHALSCIFVCAFLMKCILH